MKTIFKILGKLLLLIIINATIRTSFFLQTDSFANPDQAGNSVGIPMIFSILLIIISGLLTYVILSDIVKNKNNKLIISGLFVIVVISFYFVQFKAKVEKDQELKGVISNTGQSFKYNERLISFTSPIELKEEKLLEKNIIIKAFGNKDLSIVYIEMDGEVADYEADKNELKRQYLDFTLPKKFFKQNCEQYGLEVKDEDIMIKKLSSDIFLISLISGKKIDSTMYFSKKDNFFSTLQVVSLRNIFNTKVASEVLDSVVFK